MEQKIHWSHWLSLMIKEFIADNRKKPYFEIIDIYECPQNGHTKAVIKLSERHTIDKNISDIIMDNKLLEMLDHKTVRTLTYIATVERLKPDYSIVTQKLNTELNDYILELKSKNSSAKLVKSSSDISKHKDIIAKLHPIEAHRVGYMTGMCETVAEFQLVKNARKGVLS